MSVRRAALLLPLALVVGCAGSDPDDTAATATPPASPTASASATATAAPGEPASPAEDDAEVVAVTVASGQVTGDTGRVEVPVGSTVRLSVTSDAVDEVHVHGYDVYLDLAAGQTSQVEFVADVPGVFEVELHDAGTLLTRLQVQ